MDGDKTVTANFTAQDYELTMAADPAEGGTTTPAVGGHAYGAGAVVDITATPDAGYLFDHWTGDVADPDATSTTVTMDGAKIVTAVFAKYVPSPLGLDGAFSSNSAASGTTISVPHTTGTWAGPDRLMLVGVSANSYEGVRTISSVTFTPSVGSPVGLTLVGSIENEAGRLAAIYSLESPPIGDSGTVTVTFSGSVGNGIVVGVANFKGVDPADPLDDFVSAVGTDANAIGVDVPADVGDLVFDTVFLGAATVPSLTVDASQNPLWNGTAGRVRGAASTEQATTTTTPMSWTASGGATTYYWAIGAVPINPAPAGPTHDLTMAVNPGGGGTIDPLAGPHTYPEGTVVDITAAPAVGYVFSGWTGDVADPNDATTTVTMDADKTVTANFTAQNYDLTMAVSPSGGGTTTPAVGITSHGARSVVDITATPNTGYLFDSWTGDVADPNDPSTSVTMDGNKTVTANFTAIPPGTVVPDGTPSYGTGAPNTSSITFAHTSGTGNDRLLLVGISWNCGQTTRSILSITWNGTPLTEVKTQLGYDTDNPRYSAIYKLLNPPAGVTADVVITFSGAVTNGAIAGAANFASVDQTTPLGTPAGDGSTTSDPTADVDVTGLTGNELVFDNVFIGSSSASTTFTPGAGQSQLWQVNGYASSSSFNSMGAASTEQATGTTVTMSWTTTTNARWAIVAVPIRPTSDTTGPTVTINQAIGQADPTSAGPIDFTVTFSEPVTDFATGDVTLGGTAGATTATVTGSGTTYNVAVSGMTGPGTVMASVAAAVAHDASNNPNSSSTSTDNIVTYNPTISLALTTAWNLVAAAPGTTFPGGLWAWTGGGFQSVVDPVAWNGYWYKSDTDQNVDMHTVQGPKTFTLADDWNLIGNSMATPATVTVPEGSGLVVWAWVVVAGNGSFQSVTTLEPGQGGWVKATAGQQLTLTAAGGAPAN